MDNCRRRYSSLIAAFAFVLAISSQRAQGISTQEKLLLKLSALQVLAAEPVGLALFRPGVVVDLEDPVTDGRDGFLVKLLWSIRGDDSKQRYELSIRVSPSASGLAANTVMDNRRLKSIARKMARELGDVDPEARDLGLAVVKHIVEQELKKSPEAQANIHQVVLNQRTYPVPNDGSTPMFGLEYGVLVNRKHSQRVRVSLNPQNRCLYLFSRLKKE
jgi:hypothetical protein